MKNINRLKGFYPKLDAVLEWFPHNRIKSIVFTRRGDVHTVAFISHFAKGTDDEANFERICGYNFPTEWYETSDGWVSYVCADLESVGTDFVRVYKNQPSNNPRDGSEWLENIAYYINSNTNQILGTKHYHRNEKDEAYYIDYYDENNNLVLERQKEIVGTKEFWNGPEELFNIVKKEKFLHLFGKKENKDQAYFAVHCS
jgi:hypothetical protein|tara:strand:- start:1267 stop:1866 length:600 start_codon:yes stop_codon:yes gene_type:complete